MLLQADTISQSIKDILLIIRPTNCTINDTTKSRNINMGREWNKHIPKPLSTANKRGYIGTWEIIDRQLYLVDLKPDYLDKESKFGLKDLFGSDEKVKAIWYTGNFEIPIGDPIARMELFNDPVYESKKIIEILNGQVVIVREEKTDLESLRPYLK